MNPEKIGRFICELRKEKNLSQYQLADMIPISRQGVSKWERGVTTPDPQTLIELSKLFDVSIDELLKGERLEVKSIESLEQTTLSILDENIKKTQKIKRILTISISIITILLLSFLSYYFINSYNTMEVYRIGSTSNEFSTTDGIFITTREKYYLKLGKIKNKIDANINNVSLYYKKGNKKVLLVEDSEVDNITIMDSYGYGEKLSKQDIKKLKDNLYLQITYNESEIITIKLRNKRDYNNSNLFFLNQQKGETKTIVIKEQERETAPIEENKDNNLQEEIKPTIKEEQKQKNIENKQSPKQEEKTKVEQMPEVPLVQSQEPEITTDKIINKIKEKCVFDSGTYTCEYGEFNMIIYDEINNKISIYDDNFDIDYNITKDKYICILTNCEEEFKSIIKTNLFS